MKSTLTMLLLVASTTLTLAQVKFQTADLSEVRKNKNQVELGLSSFSRIWNGTTTGTLLFKRSYSGGDLVEVNAIKLVRVFAATNTQLNFTNDPSRSPGDTSAIFYHPSNSTDFSFGIGFEKQKKGKRLVHYHGIDFFGHFTKIDDDVAANAAFGGVTVNNIQTTDRLVQTIRAGINPFIGVKYYFNDQFSLGIETGFQAFYFNTKFTEITYEPRIIDNQIVNVYVEKTPVISNGLGIIFNGVRFVTIGYAF